MVYVGQEYGFRPAGGGGGGNCCTVRVFLNYLLYSMLQYCNSVATPHTVPIMRCRTVDCVSYYNDILYNIYTIYILHIFNTNCFIHEPTDSRFSDNQPRVNSQRAPWSFFFCLFPRKASSCLTSCISSDIALACTQQTPDTAILYCLMWNCVNASSCSF